jgi:hypothetical protein
MNEKDIVSLDTLNKESYPGIFRSFPKMIQNRRKDDGISDWKEREITPLDIVLEIAWLVDMRIRRSDPEETDEERLFDVVYLLTGSGVESDKFQKEYGEYILNTAIKGTNPS